MMKEPKTKKREKAFYKKQKKFLTGKGKGGKSIKRSKTRFIRVYRGFWPKMM